MDEIVKEVLEAVGSDEREDFALALDDSQRPVVVSGDNFSELPSKQPVGSIAFVDGGNAELFGASSFSLQLVRVVAVTYEGKKRISTDKEEFRVLVTFDGREFSVKTFSGGSLPPLSFDSMDPNLRTGKQRLSASRIVGVCRRIAELKTALEQEADHIVLDGDLYPKSSQEKEFLTAMKGENRFAGLSKTTSLMTENGKVLSALLSSMKGGKWRYGPVFEGGEVETLFVKLHDSSEHAFRLDTLGGASEELISLLEAQASDPVFPGYPYGLVVADREARVSNREAEYERTKFRTKFGDAWTEVKRYVRSRDSHDILDSIG